MDERLTELMAQKHAYRLWSYLALQFGSGKWFSVPIRSIGGGCGLSYQQTRSALDWLIEHGFAKKDKGDSAGVLVQLLCTGTPAAPPPAEPPKPKPERTFLRANECYRIVEDYTSSEAVQDAMCRWIDMRYAKSGEHRLTRDALMMGIRRIKDLGYVDEGSAVMCIDQSTFHCWDSFFPLE